MLTAQICLTLPLYPTPQTGGGSVRQLSAVRIRPYYQGTGHTRLEKTCRTRGPVNLGGAGILPEQRGCAAPPE